MKNFLLSFFCVLLVIIGLVGTYTIVKDVIIRAKNGGPVQQVEQASWKLPFINDILTCDYETTSDILQDYRAIKTIALFGSIPEETVQNVASQLFRTTGICTLSGVINEYYQNKLLYDNLTPNAIIDPSSPATQTNTGDSPNIIENAPSNSAPDAPSNPTPVAEEKKEITKVDTQKVSTTNASAVTITVQSKQ